MQEVSLNNKETNAPTLKSNAINVVTNSDKTTYNHVPQRIKCVLKAPNVAILPKCVTQKMLTIWDTATTKENKTKPHQRVKKHPLAFAELRQKMVGRSFTSIIFR